MAVIRLALIAVLALVLSCQTITAQTVRTLLIVPINFQNDTSQPYPLAQLQADASLFRSILEVESYGAVTLAPATVYDYLTLPQNKTCTPSLSLVQQGLAARGQSLSGFTYVRVVSPTTFGMTACGHTDNTTFAVEASINSSTQGTYFVWGLGLPLAQKWACRETASTSSPFVPLSAFCQPWNRTYVSRAGQGAGQMSGWERQRVGFLPAGHQVLIPSAAMAPQTFTLTPLEQAGAGLKFVQLPLMGLDIEYHSPIQAYYWDASGMVAHAHNTSRLIDFTPADVQSAGRQFALELTQSFERNGWRLTVLHQAVNALTVALSRASDPVPSWTPPRCPTTSPDPLLSASTVTDGECAVWSAPAAGAILLRNGAWADGTPRAFGTAPFRYCAGTLYAHTFNPYTNTTTWMRSIGGGLLFAMSGEPVCAGTPPPPPTAIDCVVSPFTLTGTVLGDYVNGVQIKTETWARTIITPPSGGGMACPVN